MRMDILFKGSQHCCHFCHKTVTVDTFVSDTYVLGSVAIEATECHSPIQTHSASRQMNKDLRCVLRNKIAMGRA